VYWSIVGRNHPNRRGYRTGSYTPDLVTSTERIEDLNVPRDREGAFHSQAFERYSRSKPEAAEALTRMCVHSTSSQKVGEVAASLMRVAPAASAMSCLKQTLAEQDETWRERPLLAHSRIVHLDGIHCTVRHGTQTDATIIGTAPGVDLQGNKDMLALRACAEEDKDGWCCLLQDARTRGATQMDLMVTDGHEGLLAAVSSLFRHSPPTRCGAETTQCPQRYSLSRAQGGEYRARGDLQTGEKRRCPAQSGRLSSHIPEALSRSDPESERR
jgi:transposase-like protein